MKRAALVLFSLSAGLSWGQLTPGQKVEDFQNLASLYAKLYAPAHWKVELFNYNLFNIGPWVTMVQQTTNDLDFYQIMSEYVASLNDAHSLYLNPSDFFANLGFTCDIYDGKVLIDSIDPTVLLPSKYSFQVGDELVMVDNETTEEFITDFSRFFSDANPVSTSRNAVGYIPIRFQSIDPKAEALGATATVVIRRRSGNLQTYIIPWVKTGTPLTEVGPVPLPQIAKPHGHAASAAGNNPFPKYRQPLLYLQNMHLPIKKLQLGFDALPPVFNLPAGFKQRLGNPAIDFFFTGTYQSGGKTIGYIRIPDFSAGPNNDIIGAEASFDGEIAYMEQNTDGLVVDVMRNPGGFGCYSEDLVSRLVTQPFYDLHYELRPALFDVQAYNDQADLAALFGEPNYVIAILQQQARIVTRAYQQGGLTSSIPVCSLGNTRPPNTDSNGKPAVYSKPILLLTDEFSASAAEVFASLFQDAQRGKNFGSRTMGAGGSVLDGNPAGYYSEGFASVTDSMLIRKNPIVTSDYPTAALIENIGVRPEIESNYMTTSNLLNGGKDFVNGFTAAILAMIK
jgi:hypothetical protein